MPDRPPVSWLLSVRNSMPYLPETLASIAAQTYTNHQLLAWDDCSTDGTLEELQRWIPARIPGRIFAGRTLRLGPSLAFLIEQADSELCARIDGDDINRPDRLEKQVAFMLAHPKVGVAGTQADFIDENGQPITGWGFETEDATLRWGSNWICQFAHPALMLRRSFVLHAGNYGDYKSEDTELWLRMARVCEFANLPDALIQYRRSSSSMTGGTLDFKSMHRLSLAGHVPELFPAYPADRALTVWDAAYPDDKPANVKLAYFRALENAAVRLASQVGKPREYFIQTPFYAQQRYHQRRRWLQQHGLGFLIGFRQRFA